jgi:hypothetical protein
VTPEVAGLVAKVAEPAPAGPRFDPHVHRLAVDAGNAAVHLFEDRLEDDLDRRVNALVFDDLDGFDLPLIAHDVASSPFVRRVV